MKKSMQTDLLKAFAKRRPVWHLVPTLSQLQLLGDDMPPELYASLKADMTFLDGLRWSVTVEESLPDEAALASGIDGLLRHIGQYEALTESWPCFGVVTDQLKAAEPLLCWYLGKLGHPLPND